MLKMDTIPAAKYPQPAGFQGGQFSLLVVLQREKVLKFLVSLYHLHEEQLSPNLCCCLFNDIYLW